MYTCDQMCEQIQHSYRLILKLQSVTLASLSHLCLTYKIKVNLYKIGIIINLHKHAVKKGFLVTYILFVYQNKL